MNYRKAIDERGLKHKYIAEKLNISKTMFSLFLSGDRNLQPDKVRLLDVILKIKKENDVERSIRD